MSANTRPLKVGLLLPETEGQMNGRTARWSDLLALTKTAEAVGFDSVWVTDHLRRQAPEPQHQSASTCNLQDQQTKMKCVNPFCALQWMSSLQSIRLS